MKHLMKLIALVLALSIAACGSALAVYDEEIQFRGLSWDATIEEFLESIIDLRGQNRKTGQLFDPFVFEHDNLFYFESDPTTFDKMIDYPSKGMTILTNDSAKVAGYPISSLEATTIEYNQREYLTRIQYITGFGDFIASDAFSDLSQKLSALYGEPDFSDSRDEGEYSMFNYKRSAWFGRNNTCVFLSTSGNEVIISYDRMNVPQFISEMQAESVSGNSSGL